jgi:hypothetical protein
MHWLFPSFLLGALAVALPILLHLLRRRPVRYVAFPSLRFLAATQPKNDRSQRWRRLLVLLLRCAALGLLAAAFARPYLENDRSGGTRTVIVVVDGSFSMRADGRWPRLREWAQTQIATLQAGDRAGLLVSGVRPTWRVSVTTDLEQVRTELARFEPGWETTRVEPALRLAGQMLAAATTDRREIVYVGDHQRVSWAGFEFGRKLPTGVTAVFPPPAAELKRQAALAAPQLERTAEGWRAKLTVRNYTAAQTRTLRIFRDEAAMPVHQAALTLGENESRVLSFELLGAGGDMTRFRFELDADDLPADDQVFAVSMAGRGTRLVLDEAPPGSAADFVGVAMAAAADVEPVLAVERATAAGWPAGAVAVLRNDASFAGAAGARLAAFLRAGGSTLVFVDGGLAQASWLTRELGVKVQPLRAGDGDTPLELRDWAMDHSLVAALSAHSVTTLLGWDFSRGWALPADAVEPLALWPNGGVAIGEASLGAGHVLVCGFPADRRESDWAVREGFVPFVHRAAAYLHGTREHAKPKPLVAGESLALPAESGRWRAVDGPELGQAAETVGGTMTLRAPGVYEFTDGSSRASYAVNLSSEESDPAAWSEGTPWMQLDGLPANGVRRSAAAAADAEQEGQLWWWAVAAMGVLLLAETGLANRTSR